MKEIVKSEGVMNRRHHRTNSNDLLMNMSHEFKTPLSAIQLNAQLLEKVVENKSSYLLKFLPKYIERILGQSKNVVNFLEDTMTYMRIQNEKPTMDFSEVTGQELMNELTIAFHNYYPKRVINLENTAEHSMLVDRATFFQAITKLVHIALEANPARYPELIIQEAQEELLTIELHAPNLRIKESERKSIFEPFSSLSEFNQIEALPLRLGLVKALFALNKVNIEIQLSKENEVRFVMRVPLFEPNRFVK